MEGGRAVAAGRFVVVEAVEQDLVEGRARLPLAGFDQGQPQRQRLVLDAAEIARHAAVRRANHQHRRMGELPLRGMYL